MPFPIAGSGRSMEREKPKLLESGKVKGFLEVLEYAKTGGEYMKHRGKAGTPAISVTASFQSCCLVWAEFSLKSPLGHHPVLSSETLCSSPEPPLGLGISRCLNVRNSKAVIDASDLQLSLKPALKSLRAPIGEFGLVCSKRSISARQSHSDGCCVSPTAPPKALVTCRVYTCTLRPLQPPFTSPKAGSGS